MGNREDFPRFCFLPTKSSSGPSSSLSLSLSLSLQQCAFLSTIYLSKDPLATTRRERNVVMARPTGRNMPREGEDNPQDHPRCTISLLSPRALSLSFAVVEKPVARTYTIHTYIHTYAYIYTYIHTYIYIYICIYTRLHTFRAYFRFQKTSRIHHHCKEHSGSKK
jgi:hypothetical protein